MSTATDMVSPSAWAARTTVHAEASAVWTVPPGEEGRALDALQLAFASDPPTRWLLPEPAQFRAGFPRFVRALGGGAFAAGAAHATADGRAAALWLPPGVGPHEEALLQVVDEFTPAFLRSEALAVFDAMGRCHPTEPHWYLPFIGADPAAQGEGLGSALLAHGLARCDMAELPAYLEATSPRSVPLYRRHGFEVVAILRVGSCPPIATMWRAARKLA